MTLNCESNAKFPTHIDVSCRNTIAIHASKKGAVWDGAMLVGAMKKGVVWEVLCGKIP